MPIREDIEKVRDMVNSRVRQVEKMTQAAKMYGIVYTLYKVLFAISKLILVWTAIYGILKISL